MSEAPPPFGDSIRIETLESGQIWRLWLDAPKANVIIQGEGRHFSFGASVEEHLPDQVGQMLPGFHRMFRVMLDAAVPTLAAVSGQCLGGGLEVAAFCHRVFATPSANLGQPEIVLGVLAPVASVILAERVGRGAAEDLCISGRSISGEEAHRLGLVDALAEDPGAAALEYAREHLLPRSASSLRFATRAVRLAYRERFVHELEQTERLYLDELMNTNDAVEGIKAFVEKRPPNWRNA